MTADGPPSSTPPPPAPTGPDVPGGPGPVGPPSTTSSPPRDYGPHAPPNVYGPDPDVIAHDPQFGSLVQGNTPIMRLWHGPVQGRGILWAEGPAWCAQGRYLLWSDIPNDRQLRWLEDDGHVSVFRQPSRNSNGNTFDYPGAPDLLRAPHPARGALRAGRRGRRSSRTPGTGSASTRPTTSSPTRTGASGSPTPPTGGSCTRASRTPRGARATLRGASTRAWASPRSRARPCGSFRPRSTAGTPVDG